jgi:hypothetical protein
MIATWPASQLGEVLAHLVKRKLALTANPGGPAGESPSLRPFPAPDKPVRKEAAL